MGQQAAYDPGDWWSSAGDVAASRCRGAGRRDISVRLGDGSTPRSGCLLGLRLATSRASDSTSTRRDLHGSAGLADGPTSTTSSAVLVWSGRTRTKAGDVGGPFTNYGDLGASTRSTAAARSLTSCMQHIGCRSEHYLQLVGPETSCNWCGRWRVPSATCLVRFDNVRPLAIDRCVHLMEEPSTQGASRRIEHCPWAHEGIQEHHLGADDNKTRSRFHLPAA